VSFYLLLLSFSPYRMTSDADLQQAKLDAFAYGLHTQLYHLHEQINVCDIQEQGRVQLSP